MRKLVVVVAVVAGLVASTGVASASVGSAVTVGGAVASPKSYSAAELAGADLDQLVTASAPQLPPGKNTALRVTVSVSGAHRSVTFALAELDPAFGNHPAVFRTAGRGVDLTVPGDRNASRTVTGVRSVRVAVSDAGPATHAVRVTVGRRTVTLPPALLAHLPRRTVTATFAAGDTPQTHTESGPSLALVLLVAGVLPTPDKTVVAVGSDGYGAAVTLAEESAGGRPLVLSTVEDGVALELPRLVPLGDVKGGRYVSGVTALAVG
ncbi:hypothetical protein VSH64_46250 [Amycolatopsis rhabdoformis]|uniref:Molybdopterin-dependent oxidoreductase n=1 Tax=Amycolatopsis rhabdoformis TaxID=1448059 RepID=A0ABZ1I6Z8_9PSEU|nr:hypothetical protein [Amycolatopsis rhabdoformis]WSE30117.1 hypothetical protein VSH64_46250 [Amycolatopsis rhabdoformis]